MNPALIVTVVCAVIGAAALLVVAKLRKPVSIQDLWQENASLRARVDKVESIQEELRKAHAEERAKWETERTANHRKVGFLSDGLGVIYRYMQRMQSRWGDGGIMPILSKDEQEAIDLAMTIKQGD